MTTSELDLLKEQARTLGISFRDNISLETLRARVHNVLNDVPDTEEQEDAEPTVTSNGIKPLDSKFLIARDKERKRKELKRLVRVRLTCMNPSKAKWKGEVFTFSSKLVGDIKKFVPFSVEWHVPQALLNMIKERQFTQFHVEKTDKGEVTRHTLVKEFGIEYLDPLTTKELDNLAREQALRAGK